MEYLHFLQTIVKAEGQFIRKCQDMVIHDIVALVSHKDCIPEVKEVYINFLNHCYIDTEVEVKEIYASSHMWSLF